MSTRKIVKRTKKGKLVKLDYFMLGFGSMVGVGWAVSSNNWMAQSGGPLPAFLGFIIGILLLIPIGFCYGELTSSLPVSGGVMAYTYAAFGTPVSFLSSWFVALAYLTILPWEAIYINRILSNLIPFFNSGTVLYHIGGNPIYLSSVILGLIFAFILFIINFKGSKSAAKLQTVLSWAIIVIGIIVIILSLIKGSLSNLFPFYENIGVGEHTGSFTGILSMIVLVPFFMAGFDTIAQSAPEADPDVEFKDIAKVLILSIIAAGIFYALVIISTGSVSPWKIYALENPPAMSVLLQDAYQGAFGDILYVLVMIGTLAGLFTTWNGMFMAAARLLQSMGHTGLLPSIFAKEHKKFKTPVTGSIFCFFAAAIGPLIGMKFIDPLTNLGSVAFVFGWLLTCLSAYELRKKEPNLYRRFKVPGGQKTILLAVIISTAIVVLTFIPGQPAFMGFEGLSLFFLWLILGLIFYYYTNFGSKGISEEKRQKKLFGQPIHGK